MELIHVTSKARSQENASTLLSHMILGFCHDAVGKPKPQEGPLESSCARGSPSNPVDTPDISQHLNHHTCE